MHHNLPVSKISAHRIKGPLLQSEVDVEVWLGLDAILMLAAGTGTDTLSPSKEPNQLYIFILCDKTNLVFLFILYIYVTSNIS